MKLYIVRHGQTNWNKLKKVMGRSDEELNEEGIKQAIETKRLLENENIDLIISSPLKRAKRTAEIINENKNTQIIYDDRIIERDFGEFEGLTISEFDIDSFCDYYKNEQYNKAENVQEFFSRIYKFLDEIKEKYKDKNILIVTHGGVSIPIACYFNGIPKDGFLKDLALKNCEVKIYDI